MEALEVEIKTSKTKIKHGGEFILRKGDTMNAQEVRQHITDYVKTNALQDTDNKSLVKLDAVLHDVLVARGDYVETLRWDELVSRCLSKMTVVHCVTFPGAETKVYHGRLEPIELDIVQRGSNKKATVVYNLETYGIDPEYFASTVQKGVACSVTVGPRPAKPKVIQVMVQGNQIHYIGQLLRDKYKLPPKYIRGLDKAPKMPKKRT